MIAMADMSRAIRHVLVDNSADGTLQGIPTPTLRDLILIVGAVYTDMRAEYARRETRSHHEF